MNKVQIIVSIIIVVILGAITLYMYTHRKFQKQSDVLEERLTFDKVLEKIKYALVDICKDTNFYGKDDFEWETLYNRTKRIQKALEGCVTGRDADKIVVKDLIKSIEMDITPTEEDVDAVMDLNSPFINHMIKFETIMHIMKKSHGKYALADMIRTYRLDEPKYDIEGGKYKNYAITDADIDRIYEDIVTEPLDYNTKLEIMATLYYQPYKGFGVVDTIDEMYIDGYNFGTSGSVLSSVMHSDKDIPKADRSLWLYFEGKYIHARFITFHNEEEVRRVVQLLSRYNRPGPLVEQRGFLVNTKQNKSRILAFRPGAGEYWAAFVRNFSLSSQTLESLVNPYLKDKQTGEVIYETVPMENKDITRVITMDIHYDSDLEYVDDPELGWCWLMPKHKYIDAELPRDCVKHLMRGQVTTAFTGRQGSGKTTIMTAAIAEVDVRFNIRVLEMAPEMYLRELYPWRNIYSVQETATVTAEMLQDALKKSDAALSIVGEVATNVVAARMLQMAQVASIFTIFSHHANTTEQLVDAITNSVVAATGATYETVLPQVLEAIRMDAHLDYLPNGDRFIARISEIIPLNAMPYPDKKSSESLEEYKCRLDKEYYTRRTDRKLFEVRDILLFDVRTYTYEPVEFFSDKLTKHIESRMTPEDLIEFHDFRERWWGKTEEVSA